MRSDYFLALPLMATLFNTFFTILLHVARTSHAQQQPSVQDGLPGRCLDTAGDACGVGMDQFFDEPEASPIENLFKNEEYEEEDPQLFQMPGCDFKAYVRADIATFYNEEPGSRVEQKPEHQGQAGKFVNMSPDVVSLYWEGTSGPVLNDARIAPWTAGGTATFPAHSFIFTKPYQPDQVLCRMTVTPGVSVYYCDPFADENSHKDTDPRARGVQVMGGGRSLDELSEADRQNYDAHAFNLKFGAAYKKFTGGSEWLTMYPKSPPRHKMWRADYFGQVHQVKTRETQFLEVPSPGALHRLSKQELRRNTTGAISLAAYRAPGEMNITIKALSCSPRVFEIRNFLSDVEVDHILDLVHQQNLERSTTNGHLSETRTSSTTWITRKTDPIIDAIFRRVADTLRIDEALFRERSPDERPDMPTSHQINEDLQIVHYDKGQQYTAHHDFGYPKNKPESPSRSINLCMYLNDTPKGGETSFLRWRNAETRKSIDVKPEKGKAVIFYMVNPDGNLDDLTHHAGLPVLEGEKYFTNLWIHDPIRS